MSEEITQSLIPPYFSESARTQRAQFSQYAVEEALVKALEAYSGSLSLVAHRLEPGTYGVAVRMTHLQPLERNAFPVWRGEAEITGCEADGESAADRFSRMLAALPLAGITVTTPNGSTVVFRELQLTGTPEVSSARADGLPAVKLQARLNFAIAIPGSSFAVADFSANEAATRLVARQRYGSVRLDVLERALAKHFNAMGIFDESIIRTRLLPEQCDGIYLEAAKCLEFDQAEWRDFTFVLRGRDINAMRLKSGFQALHGKLPMVGVKVAAPNGSQVRFQWINALAALTFKWKSIREREHLEAQLELSVRVDCMASSWSQTELPPEEEPEAGIATLDFVQFERALTADVGMRLGLKVDASIWRGGVPLMMHGVGARLTGIMPCNERGRWELSCDLILKQSRRNDLLELLARAERLFPLYEVKLATPEGEIPVKALLKKSCQLEEISERAQLCHRAILSIQASI